MENLLFPALIACGCSMVLSLLCVAWCIVFSPPASLRKECEEVRILANASVASFNQMEANFVQHRTEMNAIAEGVEGMLETVEKKRRSTAASLARQNGLIQVEQVPQTREEIVMAGRRATYGAGG